MPEHNPGDLGGTMRLGSRTTIFRTDCESSLIRTHLILSLISKIYLHSIDNDITLGKLYDNKEKVKERHRHRYEV